MNLLMHVADPCLTVTPPDTTINFKVSNPDGSAITGRNALRHVSRLLCNQAQTTKIYQSCHCAACDHTGGLEGKQYLDTVPLAVSQTGRPVGSNTRKGIPGTATMRSASSLPLSIVPRAPLVKSDQCKCERSFETLAIPVGMDMTAARSAASFGIITAGSTAAAAAVEGVDMCVGGWSRRR